MLIAKVLFYVWLMRGDIVSNQDHTKYRFSFDEDVVCNYMTKDEMVVYMKETLEEESDIIDEEQFYLNN